MAYRFFRWLPGRGYAFARPLGLLLTGYLFWLAANLGLLRNTWGAILFALIAVAALSWLAYRRWPGKGETFLLPWLREHWRLILVVELLFALAFVGWAWLRGFAPDLMTSGGEKFMEIAFIKAILRSDTFPPLDPWLSGFGISYYYFGYVMTSLLARFSGVPATSAFTLGIAHLFALTATGAFGVAYNLVSAARRNEKGPAIGYGLLGATFVALMGNLEGLLEAVRSKGLGSETFWKWVDVPNLLERSEVTGSWYPTSFMWWWRGSRVIRDLDLLGRPIPIQPIDEFPFFSFILGDMHPHVLALPFVLLAVALIFNLFRGTGRPSWAEIGLLVLALGGLFFLNSWDYPIYLGLALLAYGSRRYRESGGFGDLFWKDLGLVGGSLVGFGFLLYFPFYVGFGSQAGGVLPNLIFPTRLHQYLIMFGPFIFVLTCWLGLLFLRLIRAGGENGNALTLRILLTWLVTLLFLPLGMLGSVALLLSKESGRTFVQNALKMDLVREVIGEQTVSSMLREMVRVRLSDPWTSVLLALLISLALVSIWRWLRNQSDSEIAWRLDSSTIFALLLALVGLTFTLAVEWVYIRDNFGVRMNTVFKFYYQGWVLMGLASAYGSYYLLERTRGLGRTLFGIGLALLLSSGLVYTLFAGYSRAEGFDAENWTLDGAAWIERQHPDDYAAIEWLNAHAKGAPVILETPGQSYNYEGRISALTGLPSVLGWASHEAQWPGSYEEQGKREPDIEAIYNTILRTDKDATEILTLLQKYDVTYVIVGPTERARYPQAGLEKFDWLLEPVFQQGATTIYRVPHNN